MYPSSLQLKEETGDDAAHISQSTTRPVESADTVARTMLCASRLLATTIGAEREAGLLLLPTIRAEREAHARGLVHPGLLLALEMRRHGKTRWRKRRWMIHDRLPLLLVLEMRRHGKTRRRKHRWMIHDRLLLLLALEI